MKQWSQWECIEWLLGRQVFVEFAPGDDCVTLCVRAGRHSNGVYSERYKAEHNEKLSALRRAVHDLAEHDNTPCPIERCLYCKPDTVQWVSKPIRDMTEDEVDEALKAIREMAEVSIEPASDWAMRQITILIKRPGSGALTYPRACTIANAKRDGLIQAAIRCGIRGADDRIRCRVPKPKQPAYWESDRINGMGLHSLQELVEKIDPECCLHTIPVAEGGWNAQVHSFSQEACKPFNHQTQVIAALHATRWFAQCRGVYNESTDTVRIPQGATA